MGVCYVRVTVCALMGAWSLHPYPEASVRNRRRTLKHCMYVFLIVARPH